MKHLHFDCFNGISGDMTLGALVDLGVDIAALEAGLRGLPIGPFTLRAEKVKRSGIVGTKVHVEVEEDPHPHAHLKGIVKKVESAGLSETVTNRAIAAFVFIAEAEAKVHGSTPDKIHFHEVGAKDAILDITGAMLGIEMLGAESFSASTIAVGHGTVKCAHGTMPVPAPATAEILKGLRTIASEIEGELTTPTGAAILRVLLDDAHLPSPEMSLTGTGYGSGTRIVPGHPNMLRLLMGHVADDLHALPVERQRILSLECELDDMTAEAAGYVMERLLDAGALDVHFVPVQMKKNRPGHHLRVLCNLSEGDRLAEIIFRETSTFGMRRMDCDRYCLRREFDEVQTPYGPIKIKTGYWGEVVLKSKPEYESCRAIAIERGLPLAEVMQAARAAISKLGSL